MPNAIPGLPADQSVIYLLYFRQGQNPSPIFMGIEFPSTLKINEIVDRCKEHCNKMNYRFVNVRPFIVNIKEAEKVVNLASDNAIGVNS